MTDGAHWPRSDRASLDLLLLYVRRSSEYSAREILYSIFSPSVGVAERVGLVKV